MPSSTSLVPVHGSPETDDPPCLLVAWQNPDTRAVAPVGVLKKRAGGYSFNYLKRVLSVEGFRPFLGFDDLRGHYVSTHLFPLFRQRILEQDRPDFHQYLSTLGLDESASPLAVLGRSGGRRPGDSIYLFQEPEVTQDGKTRTTFFVHGVRYQDGAMARIGRLKPSELLSVRPEPDNPVNARGVGHR